MPDWSIVISDSTGSVTLSPDPQDVLSGDPVSWSNRTNNSQTITIDGQPNAAPMVAPPWDSSSPAYKVSLPANTQPPFSYTYTCKPTDTPSAPGVKGTLRIQSALAVLLVVVLAGIFAPPLMAQQGCADLFGVPSSIDPQKRVTELNRIPEITRDKTKNQVVGTLLTTGENQYIAFNKGGFKSGDITTADITCAKQWVRAYRMGFPLIPPDSNQGPSAGTTLPLPGPTIRARVGDLVELTFMNLIDRLNFPGTDTGKCDEAQNNTGQIYPQTAKGGDVPPNCFHGSIFTNVHYHGTHTSPTSAADNVFLEIVPWSREPNEKRARIMPPGFNDDVLKDAFRDFFGRCEEHLNLPDHPQQWPTVWEDLPETYRKAQEALLSQAFPKLWEDNKAAIIAKTFPQNYIGAFPYCFRLPVYTGATSPPTPEATSTHAEHDQSPATDQSVIMGQSPGTHWYHAHKHGSTTINVSNGMTGLLIVEGVYDDEIKAYYDRKGGIEQKVIVLNQIGVTPNREGGNMPTPGNYFSVNGRLQPTITMKPGEVQWWRIADTSGRSGLIFTVPAGLQWRQLAVDGVQLANTRYVESENRQFVLASGNRVDLLVMAPLDAKGKIPIKAVLTTDPLTNTSNTQLLLNVVIDSSHGTRDMGFMDRANAFFPPYLKDITKVNGYKTILFATNKNPDPPKPTPIFNRHTINGKQFHGEVSEKVDLNEVEEWKIVNASYAPKIAHPFHIHINPFQITEEFEPNALLSPARTGPGTVSTVAGTPTVTGTDFLTTFRVGDFITIAGESVANVVSIASDTSLNFSNSAKGVTSATYTVGIPVYSTNKDAGDRHQGQCFIDPAIESSWHPCGPTEPPEGDGRKWWDVFSIPSGQTFYTKGSSAATQIPGYFKMRSRFVDYSGHFVLHCHILAHEDRGMMTGVYVGVPEQLPFTHH
jgi:FtsP/CotA-like multicopper oxidase with cupredoxin domain